jgi:hypothetical protein
MLSASIPSVPSPSINALTCVAMRFVVSTPEPAAPTPTPPPPPIATEPASTVALMVASAVAVTTRSPSAAMLASCT